MMRAFLIAAVLLLAAPAAAHAADASIWSRDLPLGTARAPAALASAKRFDLVGVHWRGSGRVELRTRTPSGAWSPWRTAAPEAEDRPDRGASERTRLGWTVGNPWWAPGSTRLEVRTVGRVTRVRAWFVRSPAARVPIRQVRLRGVAEDRSEKRLEGRREDREVGTALRTRPALRRRPSHRRLERISPRGIRCDRARHRALPRKANGWNDIGYNFLVDRYGQVFEGRGGGMQRNVIGAHAEGFNTGSVGIAVIGTYSGKAPTPEAETALARLLAWRLDVGHVDPASSAMVSSGGNAKVRAGAGVYMKAISGHRDAGFTACPGNGLYAAARAAARGRADDGPAEALRPAPGGQARTVRPLQRPALPAAGLDGHGEGARRGSGCGEERHGRSHLVVLGLLGRQARPLHVDDGGRRRAPRPRHRRRLGCARAVPRPRGCRRPVSSCSPASSRRTATATRISSPRGTR